MPATTTARPNPGFPMSRSLAALAALLLASCAAEEEDGLPPLTECDGRQVADAEPVDVLLAELGYVGFDLAGGTDVVTDDVGWAYTQERIAYTASFTPDFEEEAVFVHVWTDNGCTPDPVYEAYRWGDRVRLSVRREEGEDCDMAIPMVQFVVVQTGGSTDVGTCE